MDSATITSSMVRPLILPSLYLSLLQTIHCSSSLDWQAVWQPFLPRWWDRRLHLQREETKVLPVFLVHFCSGSFLRSSEEEKTRDGFYEDRLLCLRKGAEVHRQVCSQLIGSSWAPSLGSCLCSEHHQARHQVVGLVQRHWRPCSSSCWRRRS